MRTGLNLAAALFATGTNLSHAGGRERALSNLPLESCRNHNETVSFRDSSDTECFLHFAPFKDTPSGGDWEYEARLRYRGQMVTLHRRGKLNRNPTRSSHLVSEDGKLQVRYTTRIVADSCHPDEDRCCGQEHVGKLILKTPDGIETYRIKFYRGA